MDIRNITVEDVKKIKEETIINFEKNNKDLLDKLTSKIEKAVQEGNNSIDVELMFHPYSSPAGLQNYLHNKGFNTTSSCSGNLIEIYW